MVCDLNLNKAVKKFLVPYFITCDIYCDILFHFI